MFKDLTLRSKLTGSFAAILILTSLEGYFGYQGVNIKEDIEQIEKVQNIVN